MSEPSHTIDLGELLLAFQRQRLDDGLVEIRNGGSMPAWRLPTLLSRRGSDMTVPRLQAITPEAGKSAVRDFKDERTTLGADDAPEAGLILRLSRP
ncbi:hypothetical protein [Mesorhizobium abyssinicae]|uniref:hypothetical protein n=1 Tax=Mesorhizobium abyssinicae TaxID=1209958 RepID=UPI003399D059